MSTLKVGSRIGPFPYRIVKALGSGSGNMSEVYLAQVGEPDAAGFVSRVVIKVSKAQDENQEFFEDTIFNESERLRKLDQRGIVRILPIQTENKMRQQPYAAHASLLPGNPWFLVLEFLEGSSLADLIKQHGSLDISLALEITRKAAETLEYLHYNDLVHLDIKPENILFRRPLESAKRVEPVLIDFGIARNTGQAGLEGRTLHYAPPERVLSNRGNAPPETLPRPAPSMDLYSLGVVLYQMLTGRRPFEGRTSRSISSAILEGKPTRPSKYSNLIWPDLDGLVMELLNKDPNRRPTAGELVNRIESLVTRAPYQLENPASGIIKTIASKKRRSGRSVGRSLLFAGLLLLLAIGGYEGLRYQRTGQWWIPDQQTVDQASKTIGEWINGLQATIGSLSGTSEPSDPQPITAAATETVALPTPAPTDPPAAPPPSATATDAPTIATLEPTSTPIPEIVMVAAVASPTQTKQMLTDKPTVATSTSIAEIETTPMATNTPIRLQTSTPIPDLPTFTPTNTPTATDLPTNTPKPPTNTPIPPPPTRPPPPAQPPAVNNRPPPAQVPAPQSVTVNLQSPTSGTTGNGQATFTWQANFALGPGQAFEVVFWRPGETAMKDGKGWGGAARETTKYVNLGAPELNLPNGTYYWGVLLVNEVPYQRIQYLGGDWQYNLQR